MLKRATIGLLMLVFYTAWPAFAQIKNNAFTISDDQMVLYLDLKLKKAQIDSLLRIADIKNATADALLRGNIDALQKDGWTVSRMENNRLMLLKPLNELANNAQMKPFLITSNMVMHDKQPGYPDDDVKFGINSFIRQNVHELPSGVTRFFLPANLKAKRVLLSGNFNSWSTSKGVMIKTDSGWIYDIKLNSGEYLYKFVVNGRWISDAGNLLKEDDGFDDHNSVYFKYNYTFRLKAFPKAARIMLAGSFNNWNPNQIVMMPHGGVWERSMYLHEGSHAYRFLVDGKWTKDPLNPTTQTDAAGNINSVLNIGEPVVFRLNGFANAKNVVVSGSFNKWRTNELHLSRSGNQWVLPYALPAGNYGYKFIVDGRWMTDPGNDNYIEQDGETNSFLAVKPNHTFTLKGYNNAHAVRLSGTFNDWNEPGWGMAHRGDQWVISVCLKPGKALYKYLVDGNWIIDPGNKLWEQNQFNTGNSVLWVER
ncbi:glycogen-binding domain-containing protein [Mucilaginibacter sp. AW1-3]